MQSDVHAYLSAVEELDNQCLPLNEYIDHTTEVHMKAKNQALYNKLVTLENNVTKHGLQLQNDIRKQKQFEQSADDLDQFLTHAKHQVQMVEVHTPGLVGGFGVEMGRS